MLLVGNHREWIGPSLLTPEPELRLRPEGAERTLRHVVIEDDPHRPPVAEERLQVVPRQVVREV